MPSYHDVIVYAKGKTYRLTDDYALQLHCTRVSGWRLYRIWEGSEKLLGGEYDRGHFAIEVDGFMVSGVRPHYAKS